MTSAAATALVTAGLKEAFRRSRPVYVDPVHGPHSFSFPSGHASGAFTVYPARGPASRRRRETRARALLIGAALTAAATVVAATRVLLPVHYLTDVIAGSVLGLAVSAAAMLVRASSRRRR